MVPVPTMHIQAHLEKMRFIEIYKNGQIGNKKKNKNKTTSNEKGSIEKSLGLYLQMLTGSLGVC